MADKKTIRITGTQYAEMKALLNAASKDTTSRVSLCNLFYHSAEQRLVACDGHMLRLYPVDLGKKDFQIKPISFTLSLAQFKTLHSINKNSVETTVVPLDLALCSESPYPEYEKVIPYADGFSPKDFLPVHLDLLSRFYKTIIGGIPWVALTPTVQPTGFIQIFNAEGVLLGGVMPWRVGEEFKPFGDLEEDDLLG